MENEVGGESVGAAEPGEFTLDQSGRFSGKRGARGMRWPGLKGSGAPSKEPSPESEKTKRRPVPR